MAFRIAYTPDADLDIESLSRREAAIVRTSVSMQLAHEPAAPSRKRKAMDPNPLGARWELRLGDLRVYYDIEEPIQYVRILRVGRKFRERVSIRGVETDLREDPALPTKSGD